MTAPVELFAEAARDYCGWCDSVTGEETAVAQAALRHLARLYSRALPLRRHADADLDLFGESPDDESFRALTKRLSALPFQYYRVVFDPMPIPGEEPVVGDVAEDLADIHRNLFRGLSLYDGGYVKEAEWHWRDMFEYHWGRHASDALNALHCWLSAHGEWPT